MRRAVVAAAGAVLAVAFRRWWVASRPVPAPWHGWPDRIDLFPQRTPR